MKLPGANYHWKNWVDWIFYDRNLQPQKCAFWEKDPKKLKNIIILHFITTLNNVVLKIEIGFTSSIFFFEITFYIFFKKNRKPLKLRDQGSHSETNKNGWIRFCASIS